MIPTTTLPVSTMKPDGKLSSITIPPEVFAIWTMSFIQMVRKRITPITPTG